MTAMQDFELIREKIAGVASIRDALFVLKSQIPGLGGCDLAYEYMIRDTSFVRGDLVSMTTLPRTFTDLYYPSGGPNSDPVLENVHAGSRPFTVELEKLFKGKNTKFYGNKFYASLYSSGRKYFLAYPFQNNDKIGFGAFTLFATQRQKDTELPPSYFTAIGLELHKSLKEHGQLAAYFGLIDKEKFVLARMAEGKTAADIAQELGITVRSIELRLQSGRKKLQARTTTEAVYKAVAYSILPH